MCLATKEIIPGCNRTRFVWCDDLKQINVWLYYAAMLICIGFAFPNINVTMNTLFSRIIGPRMQSKQQGMLEMFGGMGRMLGPLLIGSISIKRWNKYFQFSFLYRNYGPRAIWILEMIEVGVMGLLWLIFYRRLVPLKIPPEMEEQRRNEEHQRARGSFGDGLPN
jgi:MFS transporter, ceroid-lipofuscinosis neuronal protein 7